jgi:radical SAM protein with 4Fe4S-binding SPASM domain
MIRISRILHGKKTLGDLIKQDSPTSNAPAGRYLAFSDMKSPVIFWNITGRCNLACSHCYLSAGKRRGNELSTEECCMLINDLHEARVPLLIISGGEPLVREDIWEILDHARKTGIKTALSSNGTLINDDTAGRLLDSGVEYVGVSLDGASAATHDRIRGIPGSFERSLAGLRSCVRAGIPCGIRMTVTRDNRDEVSGVIDLALRLSVPRFCLYWLVPSGRGSEEYRNKQVSADEAEKVFDYLCRCACSIDPTTLEILSVDAPQDSVHLMTWVEKEDPDNRDALCLLARQGCHCSAGTRVANIDPEGNLYPCQFAQASEFLMGNVRKTPFSRIWKTKDRSVWDSLTGQPGKSCTDCPSYALCRGGCRIRARFGRNEQQSDDPLCPHIARDSSVRFI